MLYVRPVLLRMHDGQAMDLQYAIPEKSLSLDLFTKLNELSLHQQFLLLLKKSFANKHIWLF